MAPGELDHKLIEPLLERLGSGDRPALDDLIAIVYKDLHRMAGHLLRREPTTGRTRPTSLVNDLYLELQRQGMVEAENTTHFFHIAGYLMRQILVARARRRASLKRGAGQQQVSITKAMGVASVWEEAPSAIVALDVALAKLENVDPLKARIVELRYFGDLSIDETARALSLSPATVKRHWSVARLWLFDQIQAAGA
jgi:RNA polymerase sigma factor (TIGR02999 family)